MTLKVDCTVCGTKLGAPDSLGGKQLPCPRCGSLVKVPPAPRFLEPPVQAVEPPPVQSKEPLPTDHPVLLMPSRGEHYGDLIDMTAMVDIVFFLLIFFMVTSVQPLEAVMDFPAPNPPEAAVGRVQRASDYIDNPDYVTVTIDADNSIWLEGEQILGEQNLRMKLKAARSEGERKGLMVVGAADASHGALVTVFDAGAAAGLNELLFSVREQVDAE